MEKKKEWEKTNGKGEKKGGILTQLRKIWKQLKGEKNKKGKVNILERESSDFPPPLSPNLIDKQKVFQQVIIHTLSKEEQLEWKKLLSLLKEVEVEWGITLLTLFKELEGKKNLLLNLKLEQLEIGKILHKESRPFFQKVKGFHSPYRRTILSEIGRALSERLEIQFISPEEWNRADPNYHLVVTGKGDQIRRGMSFVVLGKKGKTLFYGEVETYSL